MIVTLVLFFMCGCTLITGRPRIEQNEFDNTVDTPFQKHLWHHTKNTFLLPRMFNLDDKINITIDVTNTNNFRLRLISEDINNATKVLCSVTADLKAESVTILAGDTDIEDDITTFLREENNALLFNICFRRRKNIKTKKLNVLNVDTNTSSEAFLVEDMDNLRFLEFNGDNIKVNELQFNFA